MDKYAKQVEQYLELASRSSLLVTEGDRQNIKVLLTMLGSIDEQIIEARYGLFAQHRIPLDTIAKRYGLTTDSLTEIIAKDLRRLAITPEWQMLLRQFSPLVRHRIGVED